jgi:23S rRNA pseudouridine1911/1915/1917 synthase
MSREARTLSVPEGVAGERIDSALTRVLGLSRTTIVRLLEDGDIRTGGRAMAKSERVTNGQVIDVLMPEPLNQDPIPLTPLDGLRVVYDDEDIVVVDKPVGCAAHPSPGWMGQPLLVHLPQLATQFQHQVRPNVPESCTASMLAQVA